MARRFRTAGNASARCKSSSAQVIPRQGNPIATAEGGGEVTSGTMSPCLEIGIGMGYVPAAAAAPGTPIEVDVRGKKRSAEVRKRPLYSKETNG